MIRLYSPAFTFENLNSPLLLVSVERFASFKRTVTPFSLDVLSEE